MTAMQINTNINLKNVMLDIGHIYKFQTCKTRIY